MQLRALLAKVRHIPKGKVSTYGEVARAAGFPGAARQVAWALHLHGSTVPWHRVVGAGGRILLGASGGMEQRIRLENEGVRFQGGRVAREYWYQFDQQRGDPCRTSKKHATCSGASKAKRTKTDSAS